MQLETISASNLFVEWAVNVDKRRGRMIPLHVLEAILPTRHNPGFRSVYMFAPSDAMTIADSASSKGFKQYAVYSDHLFIDLDGGDPALALAEVALQGYAYEVWSSGGKGYHIMLPTPMYCGVDLPQAHLEFVEALGCGADLSLYRHSSLIALPERVHAKTGKRKTKVKSVDGRQLTIEEPKMLPKAFNLTFDDEPISFAFMRFASLCETPPAQGNRHTTLWSIASQLSRTGLSLETTEELLQMMNARWIEPKSEEEVRRAASQAYGVKYG